MSTSGDAGELAERVSERPVFECCQGRGYHLFDCRNNPHRDENLRQLAIGATQADFPDDLVPYDLEAAAHLMWLQFPHDGFAVGDVFELKRDGRTDRVLRVTKVIPGPDGQVMYDTEPA
jgi:hypothetical protein